MMYSQTNRDFIIPSFNLPWAPGAPTNYTGGPEQSLDGWGAILDRDRFVPTSERQTHSVFYCPRTFDVEGMAAGQTKKDRYNPQGWTDWPLRFKAVGGDSSPKEATRIPERGFQRIVRVSYWLNAYNPIGNQVADIPLADLFYTASVGYGPDYHGRFIQLHKLRLLRIPTSSLIVAADGLYMGRQTVTQQGNENSRIGFRHPGHKPAIFAANTIFADGHVEPVQGDRFPRALGNDTDPAVIAQKRHENLSGITVYTNPQAALAPIP